LGNFSILTIQNYIQFNFRGFDANEMRKVAFTMKLIPGNEEEYEKRHREIWPELAGLLKDAGIVEYYIYLDQATGTLFAFQKLKEDADARQLPATAIMKKWWAHMADIMEVNPDQSPVVHSLKEVFEL
jgi:L-rhamnose mutarotase